MFTLSLDATLMLSLLVLPPLSLMCLCKSSAQACLSTAPHKHAHVANLLSNHSSHSLESPDMKAVLQLTELDIYY